VSCARSETGIVSAVHDISLGLARGTVTLLSGEHGCGKNLLLRIMGLLEMPDSGEVIFEGHSTTGLAEELVKNLRDTSFGYVFAPPFLLPGFTVMENIAMPLFKILDLPPSEAQKRTERLLDLTTLTGLSSAKIEVLSSGLHLRVGLARALGQLPPLIIVEEPDRVIFGAEMESFRTLLRRVATDFDCAVAVSIASKTATMPGERRIECAAGRIVCDVMP
jgi:ABC-type lipoprotein export system ATPase subunit